MRFPGCPMHSGGLHDGCADCVQKRDDLVGKYESIFYTMSAIRVCSIPDVPSEAGDAEVVSDHMDTGDTEVFAQGFVEYTARRPE